MVDSKIENRDNFVINDSYHDQEAKELDREDYYDDHSGIFRNKYINPYTIGAAGLIIIVILVVTFLSGSKDTVDSKQLKSLEAKIQQLEKKLASIGVMDQALDQIAKQEEKLNRISERFGRFNSTVTTQIDQIIKELGALHQKSSQAPQPVKTNQKKTTPKFHQVRAKETLWGISRQYGLTLDQLRSYNNMDSNATIKPGQKLKLTPN